jgi:hypothetical protein
LASLPPVLQEGMLARGISFLMQKTKKQKNKKTKKINIKNTKER